MQSRVPRASLSRRRVRRIRFCLRIIHTGSGTPSYGGRGLQMARTEVGTRPSRNDIEDARASQYFEFSAIRIKKRSVALFLMRLPAFVPFIFIMPALASAEFAKNTLTIEEAAVLGTGGEFCFFIALSITPTDYPDRATVDRSPSAMVRRHVRSHRYLRRDHRSHYDRFRRGPTRPTRWTLLPLGWVSRPSPGPPAPCYGQYSGAAEAREVVETAAEDDLRHLGYWSSSTCCSSTDSTLWRRIGGWRPCLPPAFLPGRRHQHPTAHSQAATGTALDH